MTLQEAVDELNALTNPREALRTFSNRTDGLRCVKCPVAQFLTQRVDEEVWVSPPGWGYQVARAHCSGLQDYYELSKEITTIIEELDIACADRSTVA